MVLDLTLVLTVIGIAVSAIIGFVVGDFFYHKSRQDILTATQTILGTILEVVPHKAPAPAKYPTANVRKIRWSA